MATPPNPGHIKVSGLPGAVHSGQPRTATLAELQTQLDAFVDEYNHRRPHRSLPHRATPAVIYTSRPKADPATRLDTHNRVRTDRVDQAGAVTLRTVNVLEEPEIRANLPRFSNLPTFPQLFINGELIGGCDIVMELFESGELKRIVEEATQG